MSSSAPNGTDRPRETPDGRGDDLHPAQALGPGNDRADRIAATTERDRAPESGPAPSAGGPERRTSPPRKDQGLVAVAKAVIYISFACIVLAELLYFVGWDNAGDMTAILSAYLTVLGGPPSLVYLIVKWYRGEAELP